MTTSRSSRTSARRATASARTGIFCWDWVRDNWDPVLQPALLEHVELTAIAVVIGFAISFAAALLAHRLRCVERPFALASALLYTIPSLALFQLLVPVTGLTVTTVEIALVGYTLLILFRNILAGLRVGAARGARGGARDGPDAARRRCSASSCRSRCPRSSPGCASPPSRRSRSRPSPRSSSREGLGGPILGALAAELQDGDHRRRRARRRARDRRRRAARARSAAADAVGDARRTA